MLLGEAPAWAFDANSRGRWGRSRMYNVHMQPLLIPRRWDDDNATHHKSTH